MTGGLMDGGGGEVLNIRASGTMGTERTTPLIWVAGSEEYPEA